MRILFATACKESGKDGVGDYTTALAEQIARQGHDSAVVALHDRFVGPRPLYGQAGDVEYLRLPRSVPRRERRHLIADFKRRHSPDWISLQFVPYGLNRKGIVAGWGRLLSDLAMNTRVHVMMHELWIGENVATPPRQYALGLVQRMFVVRLLRKLRPVLITTSCVPYLQLLRAAQINPTKLPLFGNIPYCEGVDHKLVYTALSEVGLGITPESRSRSLIFAMFGGQYEGWLTKELVAFLEMVRKSSGKEIVVVSVGKSGESRCNPDPTWHWKTAELGERDATFISAVLQWADFGLATVPAALVEKSGAVAAMVEHGLPVIVTRDDWRLRSNPHATDWAGPHVYSLSVASSIFVESGLCKSRVQSRRGEVASSLLNMLHSRL